MERKRLRRCSTFSASSSATEGESSTETDHGNESDDSLRYLIDRLKGLESISHVPYVPMKKGRPNNRFMRKQIEFAKEIRSPPFFEEVVTIVDAFLTEIGQGTVTVNRSSKIFATFASILFRSKDQFMVSQVKLIYLRQVEKDYNAAKKSKNEVEISKCLSLVNRTVVEKDEPWIDADWVVASKAFFTPIHVLFRCPRITSIPHVKRYAFSPLLEMEDPMRIIIDNGDFTAKKK